MIQAELGKGEGDAAFFCTKRANFTMSFFAVLEGFLSPGNILENVAATVFKSASVSAVGGFGLQPLRSVIDGTDGVFLSGGTAKFCFSLAVTE